MPQVQLRAANRVQFVSKTKVSGPTNNDSIGTPANYTDMAALDARLTAINGSYFTAAMLEVMNLNDKIYALRLADDSGTI